MRSKPRDALASVIGWLIVIVIAFWAFGLVIGWIHFVLRSVAWLVLVAVLFTGYLAVKGGPPGD
jgi:membrane-bound acyltransferase YfiQ involved in biofilm formation